MCYSTQYLYLFTFIDVSLYMYSSFVTSPVGLLLVFEDYSEAFPKYLGKKRYMNTTELLEKYLQCPRVGLSS